jgi:hypothetical protein
MNKVFFTILLLICSYTNAGTIDPNLSDSEYIKYGNEHQCVVKITGIQKDNSIFYGSAVIIDPEIIITAAHVSKIAKSAHIEYKDKIIHVSFFVTPTKYEENKLGGNGFDISVGNLSENVDLDFYPSLYEKNDEVNKVCSIAGFGITGTFDSGAIISDGKKRAGSNIVESIEDELLICSLQNRPQTKLEFLISNGDSGGGLFIEKKLAGINSSIYTKHGKLNSGRNNFSMHTRISKHYNWIKETVEDIKNEHSDFSRITGSNGERCFHCERSVDKHIR